MEQWQYLLAAGLVVSLILVLVVRSAVIKKRKAKQRDFDRKLETVLQPKETVKVVCPQKRGNCVLTSKRLLFETGEGFTAVPLTKIKKVQGVNAEGKTTAAVTKMERMTVKADKEHTIFNTSEAFEELAKQLRNKVNQQNRAKEKKKQEKKQNTTLK